jgi:D-alanyl-D-alanine carboxypeptidase (penicillin-binding protein 5/6)
MTRILSLLLTVLLCIAGAPSAPAAVTKKKTTSTQKPVAAKPKTKKKEPVEAFAVEEVGGIPKIQSAAAIVLDARTGRVLHEINADEPRPVASTQKLLTALIIAESGNLNQEIVVQPSDTWAEPSKLYIKAGESYSRYQFLQILLVKSMNDVARALARDNAGSVEAFADRMNARARELGMFSSHFVNPNGLPAPGQYSTARDMAQVALAAYHNRTIRNMVNMKTLSFRYADGRVTEFKNTNRVLRNYALCNGMKTGYTNAAGFCLISSGSSGRPGRRHRGARRKARDDLDRLL